MDDETRYIASSSGKPIATSRGYRVVDKNEFKMGVGWWEIDRESRKKINKMEGMGGKDGRERWDGKMGRKDGWTTKTKQQQRQQRKTSFISPFYLLRTQISQTTKRHTC